MTDISDRLDLNRWYFDAAEGLGRSYRTIREHMTLQNRAVSMEMTSRFSQTLEAITRIKNYAADYLEGELIDDYVFSDITRNGKSSTWRSKDSIDNWYDGAISGISGLIRICRSIEPENP